MRKVTREDFPQTIKREKETYTFYQAWTYKNTDGTPCFFKIRYNGKTEGAKGKPKKTFLYYHLADNGKLTAKLPPVEKLPPLKADVLGAHPEKDFLIVEGEKCATCETAKGLDAQGILTTTLPSTLKRSDLSFFTVGKKRNGYYLPDKDVPGYKKALEIAEVMEGIKIVRPLEEWGEGYSIDDYKGTVLDFIAYMESSDGMTPEELMELCGIPLNQDRKQKGSVPFLFMGFDDKRYYFIPYNQNVLFKMMRGNQSIRNNLEEIAPSSFWFTRFGKVSEKTGNVTIDTNTASEYLRSESYKRGIFDESSLLGVGPHVGGDGKIVINTGKSLQFYGGGEIDYNDYTGDLAFIRSKHRFVIRGQAWDRGDRVNFIEQVNTFGFETPMQKICLIGWCVTAPFASLFEFRPHIWITAKKGTGKSWLMEHVLEPAIGPFLTKVEGKTTEAAVRQTVGIDSRPVLIDEFEAHNKSEYATINGILGLARSAYGGGEIIKGTPTHEAIVFKTKMTFCFSSIKTYFSNAADQSRIVVINMKESPGRMTAISEMAGLRKMMFDRMYDLLENIKLVKKEILSLGFDERTGDTYSPLIAGYWMIISDKLFLQDKKFNERMKELLQEIGKDPKQEDEDSVLDYILSYTVRIDPSNNKTVAEMLTDYGDNDMEFEKKLKYDGHLRRIGIRRFFRTTGKEGKEVLAISSNHQEIKKIMENTAFFEYREVLSRHKAFISGEKHKFPSVYMAAKTDRVILLDWEMIEEEYLSVPEGEDGIPF